MEVETTVPSFVDPGADKPQSDNPPSPHPTGSPAAVAAGNCFDCSICLDSAADPVVTLCGHLYCWPCIYRWMLHRLETASAPPPPCPVCKSPLSESSLVPLYGRGASRKAMSPQNLNVPSRPSAEHMPPIRGDGDGDGDGDGGLRLHYGHLSASPAFHSTAGGVIGGIAVAALPWVFGNDHATRGDYDAPYGAAVRGGGRRTRARRWEREVERSLHQIWLFFFLCAVLCLLLF